MNEEKEKTIIPTIKICPLNFSSTVWNLYYYPEYTKALSFDPHQEVWQELESILNDKTEDFLRQMHFNGVPVLVGIFFSKKELRAYSPLLSRELFLLENLSSCKEISAHQQLTAFRSHVSAASEVSSQYFPGAYELATKIYGLPDLLNDPFYQNLNEPVSRLTQKLLIKLNEYRPSLFESITDTILNFASIYDLLRVHLLKFLVILPSLDHDLQGSEVKRVLLESLRRLNNDHQVIKKRKHTGKALPLPLSLVILFKSLQGLFALLPAPLLAFCIRKAVSYSARRFIAGENIEKAKNDLASLWNSGRDATLDQLGELVVSEKEADRYRDEVLKLIHGMSSQLNPGERNAAGINRSHVSIKVSALCSDFKSEAFEFTYHRCAPRLRVILLEGKKHQTFINIDAEHYDYRDIVFQIYQKVLLETPELSDYADTGIVLQGYLRDAPKHLEDICSLARKRKLTMPIRLVKGAYWDAETIAADAHSYDAPEFLNKEESDLLYRQLIVKIFEYHPHLQLCLAGHNFADHCFAEVLRKEAYPHLPLIEYQCLHMTYEALSLGMNEMGLVVRNYVPVGPLLVGMAYLVRRIMENSSQVGILTIMRSHKQKRRVPPPMKIYQQKKQQGTLTRDLSQSALSSQFLNIPPLRLYLLNDRTSIQKSLEVFAAESLGREYLEPARLTGEKQQIVSPNNPNLSVGHLFTASLDDTEKTITNLDETYNKGDWTNSSPLYRGGLLLKAASLLLVERNAFASLIVYEAGKTISEALGDVDEAIDFLNYYGRKVMELPTGSHSRGICAVISPWNFPLAIPCGMTAAPLVCGNVVILKSAEQSPLTASKLVDLFYRAGVPQDVLVHLPGDGETVGAALVNHPRVASIVFTGSKEVGVKINRLAGQRIYHNRLTNESYPVKVIAEMGGKNAIIVTASAELDETVSGILASAFSHAGQKCSAASRLIVHRGIKKRLIERLKHALYDLEVCESFHFRCSVNPVITKEDRDRLRLQAQKAGDEAKKYGGIVWANRSQEKLPGFCVGPTLIELPFQRALSPDSYAQKELFGPILHLMEFNTLEQALKLYNSTSYALTGGVFSQSQDDIDFLTKRMESGNIYVNRNITGARVAIEPFGGFKLSGTGPKAGGSSYLQAFVRKPIDPLKQHRSAGLSFSGDPELIHQYRSWLKEKLSLDGSFKQNNKTIPGQLSYSDQRLKVEKALLLASRSTPYPMTLAQVLGAMATETPIDIACLKKEAHEWWLRAIRSPYFSESNTTFVKIVLLSKEKLKKQLQEFYPPVVIFDEFDQTMDPLLKEVHQKQNGQSFLSSIITPGDIISPEDLIRPYTKIRSFAVNTVRYGAPLDLGLDSKPH